MMNDNNWQDRQWRPERIHALREGLHRSQKEMAVLIGVTERTIFRWEKGDSLPRHKMIRRLKNLDDRLITQKLKENERLARLAKEGEQGRPNEYQRIRETLQRMRLSARAETDTILRETRKMIESSKEALKKKAWEI